MLENNEMNYIKRFTKYNLLKIIFIGIISFLKNVDKIMR